MSGWSSKKVVVGKVVCLVLGGMLSVLSGCGYLFSAFSQDLADAIGVENADIVGSFGDLGNFLGVFGAIICDKVGLKQAALYGHILFLFGYIMSWLSVSNYISPTMWGMCLFFFCIGQGQSTTFICGLSVNIKNWNPKHRGKITGLLVGIISLSPLALSPIYMNVLDSNIANYFLFMTVLSGVLSLLALFILKDYSNVQIVEKPGLTTDEEIIMDDQKIDFARNDTAQLVASPATSITFPHILKRMEFYTMWFGMVFSLGCCLMWKNMFGTIDTSIRFNQKETLVIVWSTVDGLGRILFGFLQDTFARVCPRPAWVLFPLLLQISANLVFYYYGSFPTFWFIHFSTAFSTAALFGIFSGIHSLYWGTRYTGLNMGIVLTAPAVGGTLITFIGTSLYQQQDILGQPCQGPPCWHTLLIFTVFCCSVSFLLFTLMSLYHWKMFKQL